MDSIYKIMSVIEHSMLTSRMNLPSFFICGPDFPGLERFSIETADYLENNTQFRFKGIVKHFSIRMPYIYDSEGIETFLARLQESMCIAKDCYEKFAGIVIVELSKEWCDRGINNNFECLPAYIRDHQGVCFIVLVKGISEDKNIQNIKRSLSGSSVWIQLQPPSIDLEHSIHLFNSMAKDLGYEVSEEASLLLPDVLRKASYFHYDLKCFSIRHCFKLT